MGTAIIFLANPIVLNSMSQFSNIWFADKERSKATAIAGLMTPFGSFLGLTISAALTVGVELTSPK